MFIFLLGMALGIAVTITALRVAMIFGNRLHPRIRPVIARMFLSEEASTGPLPDEALGDLKQDDPFLFHMVQQAPAVPVEDQPSEVLAQSVQEIGRAKDLPAAQAVARAFVRNPAVADALAVLIRWRPQRHSSEDRYQSSFRTIASKNGYSGRIEEKPRLTWGAEGQDPSRAAYPDFVLGDNISPHGRVLVELKANLTSSSEADRAMGQMLRYLLAWKKSGPAILVVCGEASPEIRFLIRMYINTWRLAVRLPVTVYFKRDDVVSVNDLALMPAAEEG